MVNGNLVEGVQSIRNAVFSYFKDHFAAQNVIRPKGRKFNVQELVLCEGSALIKPFSEGEVKAAFWDCDSFKSPGPDGVNFGFIKEFWDNIKGVM
jgi:hypothetical protein